MFVVGFFDQGAAGVEAFWETKQMSKHHHTVFLSYKGNSHRASASLWGDVLKGQDPLSKMLPGFTAHLSSSPVFQGVCIYIYICLYIYGQQCIYVQDTFTPPCIHPHAGGRASCPPGQQKVSI